MEETPTTGNIGMGGSIGTGGVHSHIGVQPSKGEGDSGKFGSDSLHGGSLPGGGTMSDADNRSGSIADQARDQASNLADQARNRMGDVREQAGDALDQARNRVSGLMDQAQDSQPVQMARDNPLPALGIAFALGFLLAGSSDTGGRLGKAKQQVKGAVMGGISAALAQELRNVMGGQGAGVLDSLLGSRQGSTGEQGTGTGSSF